MSRQMIANLHKAIDRRYHLERSGRDWMLANDVKLRTPDRHSIGFSLDHEDKPLAFFGNNPPEHIAKMCDAIVVLAYKDQLHVFVVEQKTGNEDECKRQLANGNFFCQWLVSLFRQHGYYSDQPMYTAMLVWQPRRSPSRAPTSHARRPGQREPFVPFTRFYSVENQDLIQLQSFIPESNGTERWTTQAML